MKYLKTYEKFLDGLVQKFKNYLNNPSDEHLYDAEWYDNEKDIMIKKFGFNIVNSNIMEYKSMMNDFFMRIEKFYEEQVPGYAPSIFKVYMNGSGKRFEDFDELVKFIEENLPEEDINAKKYNL